MTSWALILAPGSRDDERTPERAPRIGDGVGEVHEVRSSSAGAATGIDGIPSETWVMRIRAGDPDALSAVYRALRDRLWRFAMTLVGDDARAHDIVQDVFATVWTRRDSLVVRDDLVLYLFGAVRHRASKVHRHQAVVRRFEDAAIATSSDEGSPATPDVAAELDDLRRAVHAVIETLPARDRAALMLRWSEERTYEEIGRVLGVTAMGAHKMVMRALGGVRPLLERLRDG